MIPLWLYNKLLYTLSQALKPSLIPTSFVWTHTHIYNGPLVFFIIPYNCNYFGLFDINIVLLYVYLIFKTISLHNNYMDFSI